MSRFGGLDAKREALKAPKQLVAAKVADSNEAPEVRRSIVAKARQGKKPVQGYFSEELSRELRKLSIDEGTTVQALLGEAIDLLLTARGKNRFGER